MKTALLAGLLLATTLPLAAQQRLTGKILDAATGQPVPYASVSVLNSTAGTTSNAEGEFELRGIVLPAKLLVSELGHQRDTVAVAAAATAPLLVRLQPTSVLLPEVQVGSYLGDLIAQAYRQMRRTNAQNTYGQAFYRQVTRIAGDATEVQEMVWNTATNSAGMDGSAFITGRFAKKKARISFNNFSNLTKSVGFNMKDDSLTQRGIVGLNTARCYKLSLIGVTQNGRQHLVEIGFESKPGLAPLTAKGTLVIDETTRQVLHMRFESPDLIAIKINSVVDKLKEQQVICEMDFQPAPNAALLSYIKVDYQAALVSPLERNVAIRASSFTYFYNGRPTPDASATYASPKGGEVDLAAIKKTTYDPAFWQNNPVVKRTPLEEQVMKSFEQKGAFGTMLTP
ncbi:hypothetical protein GCM10022409_36090 [Hymenobacter glaciei]|uniref:Carboxypeptidase-like regulatory domain-containing protein n=1 Tax=Hymenobacter glaciei TaxID=877209 RepID=A0ABP7ULR7_9BACT